MLKEYKYSEKEQKQLLNNISILVDTREKKNDHILKYFNEKLIGWERQKLDYGDYSVMIPANPELGIPRDLYLGGEVMVERKANLDELAGNLSTNDRNRIKAEFASAPATKIMLVENASYQMLADGQYMSSYNPKSYWATCFSMWHQYNLPIVFIENNKYTGQYIYGYLYYYVRNLMK